MKRLPVLALTLVLSGCATATAVDTSGWTYAPHELTTAQRAAIENAVKVTLKDPDSARFSRFKARKAFMPGNRVAIQACGFVNAKNSFGGYTGASPFAGAFPYDDHSMFRISSWREQQLAPAVAEGCAQMGLLAGS